MPIKVGILTINNNESKKILDLLSRVNLAEYKVEGFVLDNNCQLEESLKKKLHLVPYSVVYETSDEELSFAVGMNLLARRAISSGCTVMVFLDGVLEFENETLDRVVSRVKRGVGVCGSNKISVDSDYSRDGGSQWQLFGGLGKSRGEVDWVEKGLVAVDGGLFARLGGFEEAHYIGLEVVEFCLRAKSAGESVEVVAPDKPVEVSRQVQGGLKEYFFVRNRFMLLRNIYSGVKKWAYTLSLNVWLAGLVLRKIVSKREGVRSVLAGWKDGWELLLKD